MKQNKGQTQKTGQTSKSTKTMPKNQGSYPAKSQTHVSKHQPTATKDNTTHRTSR